MTADMTAAMLESALNTSEIKDSNDTHNTSTDRLDAVLNNSMTPNKLSDEQLAWDHDFGTPQTGEKTPYDASTPQMDGSQPPIHPLFRTPVRNIMADILTKPCLSTIEEIPSDESFSDSPPPRGNNVAGVAADLDKFFGNGDEEPDSSTGSNNLIIHLGEEPPEVPPAEINNCPNPTTDSVVTGEVSAKLHLDAASASGSQPPPPATTKTVKRKKKILPPTPHHEGQRKRRVTEEVTHASTDEELVEAPPVEVPSSMDTGHVVTIDPPESPPPPPVVVVEKPAEIQRESKRRKTSSVTSPKKSDQPDWIIDPVDDSPVAETVFNQALMESPPTTPTTSTPGIPAMPPPPRKSGAVETQARLVAVGKRKAIVSPGDQPAKPSPPTQPPPPTPSPAEDQPSGQPWSLQAGKLPTRYARLVKTNIGDVCRLLCQPSLKSYEPLPRTEGEFSVRRITMNDGEGSASPSAGRDSSTKG
ncbi:fibrous sheath CABYR-binding protein-like [Gigantopelta aegis]|uniref:fibrous sheath CABYR-binding protein-like n=1 Tax=Gigantopelta aegis TaxID=1735272 RepID=UPI001B8883F2|nr:fibrous sheath CABYR-binding protein-like [Gigantopelta aegis]